MSPYTITQQVALAVIPKVSGFVSCGMSLAIIGTILRDQNRRSKTYHRLICGLSVVDCSSSFWLGLSTWPIPRDSGVLWAVGTPSTCRLQSFFTQAGIGSILYNASLSLYFVLVIKRGWREPQIRKIEAYLHALPLAWAIGSACVGLGVQAFGSANLWCWVAPDKVVFRWVAFYGPLWVMILAITGMCLMILLHVRKIEIITDRRRQRTLLQYSGSNPSSNADLSPRVGSADALDENGPDSSLSCRVHIASEANATAGEEPKDYQDDELDPNDFANMEDDMDDGTLSGEYCVASSVFEDVVLSRTNQTLSHPGGDTEPCDQPSSPSSKNIGLPKDAFSNASSVDRNSHGTGMSSAVQVRRSYRNSRRRASFLLARDELRLKRTRQVARQSFLYAGAFYLNWIALSVRVFALPYNIQCVCATGILH
jgi:G protein-coupled glucose receptor regulating Gpa2